MATWRKLILYNDVLRVRETERTAFAGQGCFYCARALTTKNRVSGQKTYRTASKVSAFYPGMHGLSYCQYCGWWTTSTSYIDVLGGRAGPLEVARVMSFDISSLDVPVEALTMHLARNTEDLYYVHPRVFEDVVLRLLNEHLSCDLAMSQTSRDGGYDLFGLDADRQRILVQVKRYKSTRKIGVSVIREFAGVLLREDVRQGIVVTTTRFTRPARQEAAQYVAESNPHRIFLELKDIEALCSWLDVVRDRGDPSLQHKSELYRRIQWFEEGEWPYLSPES